MKKRIIILLVMVCVVALVGCTVKQQKEVKPESLVGYIVIEDNTLYLDKVEIITLDDTGRIKELGLKQQDDLPNGYYIYNKNMEIDTYYLTDETVYNFVDSNLLFVEDEDGDRSYTSTKKEEYVQHLSTSYSDVPPAQTIPFFLEVKGRKVVSITEKIEFTI